MQPYYQDATVTLWHGANIEVLPQIEDRSVDCVVTSPPYFGLRDYGAAGQYGAEETPAEFVGHLVNTFREVARVLADDGTVWLNLGDSYVNKANGGPSFDRSRGHGHRRKVVAPKRNMSAHAPLKSLLGIPWRVALALQDDGWVIRNAVVWNKPNAMPESVTDRLSGRYELLFLLSKCQRYWFDLDAIREPHAEVSIARAQPHRSPHGAAARAGAPYVGVAPAQTMRLDQMNHPAGRNPGDVWTIPTVPFPGPHFAAYPPELVRRCVVSGCRPGGTVLDPFHGSGTTGMVAQQQGRRYVGIEINREYLDLSLRTRLADGALPFDANPVPAPERAG